MALSPYILEYLLDNCFENNYIEIGVFDGGIISEVAKKYTDKKCYGIDPFIEDGCTRHISGCQQHDFMSLRKENTLQKCTGHENIQVFEMKSDEFYQHLTDAQVKEMNIGCVVVDGDHSETAVGNDIELALKLLDGKGGLIIFDDWQLESVSSTVLEKLPNVDFTAVNSIMRIYYIK